MKISENPDKSGHFLKQMSADFSLPKPDARDGQESRHCSRWQSYSRRAALPYKPELENSYENGRKKVGIKVQINTLLALGTASQPEK